MAAPSAFARRGAQLVAEMAVLPERLDRRGAAAGAPPLSLVPLPPHNDETVDQVFKEIEDAFASLQRINEMVDVTQDETGNVKSTLVVLHYTILRNKRCLMAYYNARLQRIKSYRWNTGRLPPDMLDNMTPSEKAFLEEYEELLTDYSTDEDADRHLDLFLDMKPPRDPFVKVLVRKTLGDIDFKFMGTVRLEKGSVVTLPRDEAERLILEGLLEHIEG